MAANAAFAMRHLLVIANFAVSIPSAVFGAHQRRPPGALQEDTPDDSCAITKNIFW